MCIMETPCLDLFFAVLHFRLKKYNPCRPSTRPSTSTSNEHSYQVWLPLVSWFQSGRLKGKSLPSTTEQRRPMQSDENTSNYPLGPGS